MKTVEKLKRSEGLVKLKANEIKLLQSQVLYYKKKDKEIKKNDAADESNDQQAEPEEIDVK